MKKLIPGGWSKNRGTTETSTADLYAKARAALQGSPYSGKTALDGTLGRIAEAALQRASKREILKTPFNKALRAIAEQAIAPTRLENAPPDTIRDPAAYRALLRAIAATGNDSTAEFIAALAATFTEIADALPATDPDAIVFPFTMPLIDAITDPVAIITGIIERFLKFAGADISPLAPAAVIGHAIKEKLLRASQLTEDAARKNKYRLVWPAQSGLASTALARAYLPDALADCLATPIPFSIRQSAFARHGTVFGGAGSGKSMLALTIAHTLLQLEDGPGFAFFDPHSDAFELLSHLAEFKPGGRHFDRVVIIDPATKPGPRLSFFNSKKSLSPVAASEVFKFLMASISSEWSPVQDTAATYLLQLMSVIPNATLETFLTILTDPATSADASHFADAIAHLDDFSAGYFREVFYTSRMRETRMAMSRKLYALLGSGGGTFREMFSTTECDFDALAAIRNRKVVLINGARNTLGHDGMAVMLNYFVAQLYIAAFAQAEIPHNDRPLFLLLSDESHYVLQNPIVASILTETRKYNVGGLFLTQMLSQASQQVRAALTGSTAIRFAASLGDDGARDLAPDMGTTPAFLQSMKSAEGSHGEFAVWIDRANGNRAVRVRVPFGIVHAAPRMTDDDYAKMRAAKSRPAAAERVVRRAGIQAQPIAAMPAPVRKPRDFGTIEPVTMLGLQSKALLDTGAQVSALVAATCAVDQAVDRVKFTIATRDAVHAFSRPRVGDTTITGVRGTTSKCPIVEIEITIDDYTTTHRVAVTLDPDPQSTPLILGTDFFAAAPFIARITPNDTMKSLGRPRPSKWNSDDGEPSGEV